VGARGLSDPQGLGVPARCFVLGEGGIVVGGRLSARLPLPSP